MDYKEIKEGIRVIDGVRVGIVEKKLKTVVYVRMSNEELVRYDKPHLQFLKQL